MIGRKSLLIVISKTISALLGYVGFFLITRYLPKTFFGEISYTMSLVALFFAFSDLGFATSHIKRISEGKDPDDCLSSYLVIKVLLVVGVVSAIFLSLWVWTGLMDRPLNDTSFQLVALFTLYFVFYNVAQIATATFDAHMKTAKTQISLISEMVIRLPLILFFAIPQENVFALAWAYVLGGLAVAVVAIFLLFREGLRLKRPTLMRSMAIFAMPLAFIVVLGVAIGNIDKVTLGFFWNSEEVATYAAGQTVLNMLFVFGAALSTLLFPTFSRLHEDGDKESMKLMVRRGERYLSYIVTPIVCVFLIFPTLIAMVLAGPDYLSSAAVMQVLCLNVLILSLGSVYSTQIVALNRAKELVWLTVLQLGLLLLFLVLFVPSSFFQVPMLDLKAVGTAYAVLLSTLIVVVLYRIMVWRMIGLGFNRAMSFHLIAAFLSIGTLLAIQMVYSPTRWYDILLIWAASAGVFYLALYLMREMRENDIRYFLEVLSPVEMGRYLRSEFRKKP
ncbi:MAG TPA: flippase [Methanomassiliicoccales archaeon]|nr:flippase [Methanomassiliicoccales archaeon]